MPHLVEAYLEFRLCNPSDSFLRDESAEVAEVAAAHPPGTVSEIELVDIFGKWWKMRYPSGTLLLTFHAARCKATLVAKPCHVFANKNLIYHGYLGCSPVYPNIAISLCTLAVFRQAHRTCPHFSIQAQCKMMCYLHNVSQYYTFILLRIYSQTDALSSLSFLSVLARLRCILRDRPSCQPTYSSGPQSWHSGVETPKWVSSMFLPSWKWAEFVVGLPCFHWQKW